MKDLEISKYRRGSKVRTTIKKNNRLFFDKKSIHFNKPTETQRYEMKLKIKRRKCEMVDPSFHNDDIFYKIDILK